MVNSNTSDLTQWRQQLHQQPELSGEEVQTAAMVYARLAALKPDALIAGLGGHGVLAQFKGANPKRRVLIRCELDGLPIPEINTFAHRSQVVGKGHLCGHDGHTAIVMGVATALAAKRIDHTDILLLFQPAEETGAGAKAVLEDPQFQGYKPDFSVALHNMPGLPLGQIQIRPGPFCCASRGLKIQLSGRTAHASQPETGLSPANVMMELMAGLVALNSPPRAGQLPQKMATLTHAKLGEPTFGVAPGTAELRVTLRTVLDEDMRSLCEDAERLVKQSSSAAGLGCDISYHDIFPASTNHQELTEAIQKAAARCGIPCHPQPTPMRWSEDFGRFSAISPTAMFLLGAGETCPALHNPDYDFPDVLIEVGVNAFLAVIETLAAN